MMNPKGTPKSADESHAEMMADARMATPQAHKKEKERMSREMEARMKEMGHRD